MTQTSVAIAPREKYIDIPVLKKVGAPLAFSKDCTKKAPSFLSPTHFISSWKESTEYITAARNHLKPFKSVCCRAQNCKNNDWMRPSYNWIIQVCYKIRCCTISSRRNSFTWHFKKAHYCFSVTKIKLLKCTKCLHFTGAVAYL